MDNINKQIEDIQKKGQAGANTLSEEEKVRMQRQYQLLQNQLKRASDAYDEQMQAAGDDIANSIARKMLDVIDSYSRENGLDCVLNTSSEASISVLYKNQQMDVTQEIVKLYDQRYPVKATATTAPTKPATPPATPPVKKPGGTGQQN